MVQWEDCSPFIRWLAYRRSSDIPSTILSKKSSSLTIHSPVQKYLAVKRADTGLDPTGTLRHFIKKDLVANIDVHAKPVLLRSETPQPNSSQTFHAKKPWISGCQKYQAVRHDEWQESGLIT